MTAAYVYAAVRTPFGKFGGGLAESAPMTWPRPCSPDCWPRRRDLDPGAIGEVVWGNANGAGEENRNVGRMAVLLAGLPVSRPGHHGEPAVRVEPRRRHDRLPDDRDRRRRHRASPAAWSR